MLQGNLQIKLFCNTQGGENILSGVSMGFQGNLPFQHRDQRFVLHIKSRPLRHIIPCCFLFLHVLPGFEQCLPQKRRGSHTAGILLILIHPFGILAESTFHGNAVPHHHIIHPSAHGLDSGKGTAQHIGAPRSHTDTGDPRCPRHGKSRVHGLHPVNPPHLRTDDIVHLIVIHAFITDAVPVQTDVSMSLHKARIHLQAFCIHNLGALRDFQILPDCRNFAVLHQDISPEGLLVHCIMNHTVFYT